MINEECWMFAPRGKEIKFLQYYLQHKIRPGLTLLSLERDELPVIFNLASQNCDDHKIVIKILNSNFKLSSLKYRNRGFLTRAVANSEVRRPFEFSGRLHVFYFEKAI